MDRKVIERGIVISEDIQRILQGHNALGYKYDEHGILVPNKHVIEDIRKDFKQQMDKIFENVVIVKEDDITESMKKLAKRYSGKFPIISLDEIYLDKNDNIYAFLDCTRLQNDDSLISRTLGKNISVEKQIENISNALKSTGQRDVIIADDVIFSGNGLVRLCNMFKQNGINVIGVVASFCTISSFVKFNNDKMFLDCDFLMDKEVIDEICERDFYFGIAQSGISRRLDSGKIVKEPYFKPYGDPEQRASIPNKDVDYFSKGCLCRSKELWYQAEKKSKKNIYVEQLPETINKSKQKNRVVKELDDAERQI